jgi:hypothetical protein
VERGGPELFICVFSFVTLLDIYRHLPTESSVRAPLSIRAREAPVTIIPAIHTEIFRGFSLSLQVHGGGYTLK